MLWPTFTKDSDDSDDNDTNNNNLNADFELYCNGNDPELDHILEILNDDDRDIEFDGFLPEYERNVAFDFNDVDVLPNDVTLNFTERSGPTRVFDASATALNYFQLFFILRSI